MSRKRSREALEAPLAAVPRRRGREGRRRARPPRTVFDKVVAFSEFGFPKSHAAAFAILAYQSAWLHRAYPARVPVRAPERPADGLLPAGDAASRRRAAGRRDAARRTSTEAPPSAPSRRPGEAVRIGLGYVKGVGTRAERAGGRARPRGRLRRPRRPRPPLAARTPASWRRWCGPAPASRSATAAACCGSCGLHRAPAGPGRGPPAGAGRWTPRPRPPLPRMSEWERMVADHEAMGLTTGPHPMALLRESLDPAIAHRRLAAQGRRRPGDGGRRDGRPPAARPPPRGSSSCWSRTRPGWST